MDKLKEKLFKFLLKTKKGDFFSYSKVAKIIGFPDKTRILAKILSQNRDFKIPCHRVIYNNNEVGWYLGKKNFAYLKAAKLLKEGAIGVMPTDTVYGICVSAFNKKAVEKVYKLRKRSLKKPCIILISQISELKKFEINLSKNQEEFLKKIWPARISVILKCLSFKFKYLHRNSYTLAFRLPKKKTLIKILKISGPLIAPSANFEGEKIPQTIYQAKKYFKNKVFYLNGGKLNNLLPSTIIDLTKDKSFSVIRKGADFKKISYFLKT